MPKFLNFLRLGTLLPLLVFLFLVWQVWLFLRPGPEPLNFGESRAAQASIQGFINRLATTSPNQSSKVGVVSLFNDRSGEVSSMLRESFHRDRRFLLEQTSIPGKIITDIGAALAAASSLPDVTGAGRQIGLDLIIVGRIDSISSSQNEARVDLQLSAYDTHRGEWVLREVFTGEWRPGVIEGWQATVDSWPIWQRMTLWLVLVLVLPWITPWASKAVLRKESNTASGLLILSYASVNLLTAAFLIGFSLSGFLPWLGFLAASLFAIAYPWWSCERIASGEK